MTFNRKAYLRHPASHVVNRNRD